MKDRQNTLKSLLIERFGSGNDPGPSDNPYISSDHPVKEVIFQKMVLRDGNRELFMITFGMCLR